VLAIAERAVRLDFVVPLGFVLIAPLERSEKLDVFPIAEQPEGDIRLAVSGVLTAVGAELSLPAGVRRFEISTQAYAGQGSADVLATRTNPTCHLIESVTLSDCLVEYLRRDSVGKVLRRIDVELVPACGERRPTPVSAKFSIALQLVVVRITWLATDPAFTFLRTED
jgi:hypothetical protein